MWHVLKLDYTTADASEMKTKMIGYGRLDVAEQIFNQLQLGYQLNATVRVKGGKGIKVKAVQLYESFKEHLADAIEAVKSQNATLMQEAKEVDLDISD
jgi:hypothetical protein